VRITAQLIDARSDAHLWSRTFDREMADVFAVQTEIARTVADALQLRLADAGPPPAPSVVAHDLYLQGHFLWNHRSPGDLRRAIQLFEDATRTDPTYARAFAGLATAYASLPITSSDAPVEATLAKAEQAATRAIALDSSLAEAYSALGYAYHWQWRWKDAERALRRATELDPNNTAARQWYAEHLVKMGRGEEAEAEARRAVMLDPLSPIANVNLGLVLMISGRFREAIAQVEQTGRMDPSLVSVQGPADRTAARAVLERWKQIPKPPWPEMAMYYALMGERDQALEALEHGLAARSPMMAGVNVAPWLDPMRDDPRFVRIVRAMHLP
jgi:tetratricopeptide (TPR) repeat protein